MKKSLIPFEGPMPILGLGTWRLSGSQCEAAVKIALELGYRHIDTADVYGNHGEVGRAIKHFQRSELFITTKINIDDLDPKNVKDTCLHFLEELDTPYIDLLLIHWPNTDVPMEKILEAMVQLQNEKLILYIGVSNFPISLLESLKSYAFPILTNQIELHPYLQQPKVVKYCKEHNIIVTAYRPIEKGRVNGDPVLQSIGCKYNKTPIQVALRYFVQKKIVVIPKASSFEHLKENIEIFDFSLNPDEMSQIEALDRHERHVPIEGVNLD